MGVDRRQLFARNWQSMHNLSRPLAPQATPLANPDALERDYYDTADLLLSPATDHQRRPFSSGGGAARQIPPLPARHAFPFVDLAHFQDSWTTGGDVQDLFGTGGLGLGPSPPQPMSSSSRAYASQTFVLDSPLSPLDRPDSVSGVRLSSTATAHSTMSANSGTTPSLLPLPSLSQTPRIDSLGVSSVIHDAARITNWDQVLELCRTHPEAARYTGRDGWTALHHACNRRCPFPHVVEALIAAHPGALLKQDKDKWGWLPLHYACRFKAPTEVVRLLLHLNPERGLKTVAKRDRMGRTPLFYAIRYDAPPGVVGLLLEVDPSAVLEEDQNADSPLALVWDSWAEKMEGKRIVASFLPGGFPEPEDTTVEERAKVLQDRLKGDPKLHKRWRKANVLLRAAFGFPVDGDVDPEKDGSNDPNNSSKSVPSTASNDDDASSSTSVSASKSSSSGRRWRIVHATAAVKCHLSLFLLACALHPEQIQEMDEFDLRRPGDPPAADRMNPRQTALHLAASSNAGGEPGKTVLLTLLSHYREAAQIPDGIDDSLPLHRMVENPRKRDWSNHAAILYRFYPRAVQIADARGRLPLHRAAAAVTVSAATTITHSPPHHRQDADGNDEENVVLQLLRAFPQAASHADTSGLLPFHLLASHAQNWDAGVEAVYNIHRNAVLVRAGPQHHHRLPLHMAAASAHSREPLLARLLLHHPRAASMVDDEGKLPFHLACEIGKHWNDGTRCLHAAFPQAARTREDNPRGWFPLHLAAHTPHADADLIARLVELHPEAAGTPDADGRSPLHLACRAGKAWLEGINVLFDADPNPMASPDRDGLLPFHLSALRYCRPTTSATDDELDDAEFEDALPQVREARIAREAAEVDILFHLLRADPTVLESY